MNRTIALTVFCALTWRSVLADLTSVRHAELVHAYTRACQMIADVKDLSLKNLELEIAHVGYTWTVERKDNDTNEFFGITFWVSRTVDNYKDGSFSVVEGEQVAVLLTKTGEYYILGSSNVLRYAEDGAEVSCRSRMYKEYHYGRYDAEEMKWPNLVGIADMATEPALREYPDIVRSNLVVQHVAHYHSWPRHFGSTNECAYLHVTFVNRGSPERNIQNVQNAFEEATMTMREKITVKFDCSGNAPKVGRGDIVATSKVVHKTWPFRNGSCLPGSDRENESDGVASRHATNDVPGRTRNRK